MNPIRDAAYLRKLMESGYVLEGPRQEHSKDLLVFERFLSCGHVFIPENWLLDRGYKFVDPCDLTKGFKLAYMVEDDDLIQYFRSNYVLRKEDEIICLYLREE